MLTPRERRDIDDLNGALRRTTDQLTETKGQLQALFDAAESFTRTFDETERGRRGGQLQAFRHAAKTFVEAFTQVKIARGYRMS